MEEIVGSSSFKADNAVWNVDSPVALEVGVWTGSKALEDISCLTLSFTGITGFMVSLTGSGFVSFFLGATTKWRGPGCFLILLGKVGWRGFRVQGLSKIRGGGSMDTFEAY